MNNLNDLNEILFSQIRKLENDDLTDEYGGADMSQTEIIILCALILLAIILFILCTA